MLNREENEIMRAVYELCGGKGCCLVSPYDLMSLLPAKRGYTAERVDRLLRSLELDDYFDLLESDRKGERMYVCCCAWHFHKSGRARSFAGFFV